MSNICRAVEPVLFGRYFCRLSYTDYEAFPQVIVISVAGFLHSHAHHANVA
eukprot:m.18876 g.18876  ORF g.18876 m.18876 type:complete len:51 (-) comp8572_c0_seq1:56-208(-)